MNTNLNAQISALIDFMGRFLDRNTFDPKMRILDKFTWSALAKQERMRRVTVVLTKLDNETLEHIADGSVDFTQIVHFALDVKESLVEFSQEEVKYWRKRGLSDRDIFKRYQVDKE
jgi:hypothetical protein